MTQQREQKAAAGRLGVRLGVRLGMAAVIVVLVAIPFTLLAVLARQQTGPVTRLDTSVAVALNAMMNDQPWLVAAMRVVAVASEPWVLRAVTAVIVVILWRRGRRRVAAWLAVTMAVGGVLGVLLKLVVARARPEFDSPVATSGGYSFPSGHALNAMVFGCCMLVLLHPRTRGAARAGVWLATLALVLLVGFNRISLGVHYVSDVIAGYIVAVATVLATVAAFALWQRQEGVPAASIEAGLDPEQERA